MRLRYTPIRKIADGDTAEFFLATQHGAEGFEKRVILKRILPALYADKQFRKLLVDEAHIAAGLNHSSIVQVLDLGETDGRYFMALELVDGWTLERVLRRAQAANVPIPPALALYITAEVCRALSYAHGQVGADGKPLGIVHGDICPDNVLLSAQGEVKITDFGMAKAHSRRTQVTGILKPANAAYMSPEQVGGRPLDPRSDLFSAGSMLYTMITGREAFGAEDDARTLALLESGKFTPSETVKPELGPDIHRLIARAMAIDPASRFERAEEMLIEVERVMRIALRPVGQTELMRWLSQLSEKDGVPSLTRDTGAPATAAAPAPATSTSAPVSASPLPPPPAIAPAPPRLTVGGLSLPPPPPGNVPQPVVVALAGAGAAPDQTIDDTGTQEIEDEELELAPAVMPPPFSGDATVITPTAPNAAQAEQFDIPRVAGVDRDRRRSRLVWITGGSVAAAMAIVLGVRVMLSSPPAPGLAANPLPAEQPAAAEAPPAPAPEPKPIAAPPPAAPPPAPEQKVENETADKAAGDSAGKTAPAPAAAAQPAPEPAENAKPATEPAAPPAPESKSEEKAAEEPVSARAQREAAAAKSPAKDSRIVLVVKSTPSGCYLTAAGKALGHTPVVLRPQPGTKYHFAFSKAGHETIEKTFAVSERSKQSLHVTLKKTAAKPAPAAAPAPQPAPKKEKHWWEFGSR